MNRSESAQLGTAARALIHAGSKYSCTVVTRTLQLFGACVLGTALAAVPAQAAIPTGQTVDGVHCDASEGVAMHIHPHLTILDHGRPVAIPEDVGRPLAGQCFYWLHTHTPDGIIHVESPTIREFTLGQFFDVWGQPLNSRDVAGAKPRPGEKIAVFVDGDPYSGDPRRIEFAQHLDIAIVVGPPYAKPPPFTQWNGN